MFFNLQPHMKNLPRYLLKCFSFFLSALFSGVRFTWLSLYVCSMKVQQMKVVEHQVFGIPSLIIIHVCIYIYIYTSFFSFLLYLVAKLCCHPIFLQMYKLYMKENIFYFNIFIYLVFSIIYIYIYIYISNYKTFSKDSSLSFSKFI